MNRQLVQPATLKPSQGGHTCSKNTFCIVLMSGSSLLENCFQHWDPHGYGREGRLLSKEADPPGEVLCFSTKKVRKQVAVLRN